ncbi:OmpA family protein [Lacibacter sp. H407]|uniref:OmpA family protein n=1 Tax=Lacibacter sp. H407 TaxID=3133423 RepID=UPI0030BB3A26
MKKLTMLCILSICTYIAIAQTQDKKWNIGLHGGAAQYKGDLGNDFYKTDMAFYGFGGLSLSHYIGSHLDLTIMGTRGKIGFNRPSGNFVSDVTTASVNLRVNVLGPNSPVRPYGFVGFGAMLFDKKLEVTKQNLDFATPTAGAGLNIKLGPVVNLNLQETFLFSNRDRRDGVNAGKNDEYLFHSAGLTFNLGKKKDADNDGVADRLDKCPNTPAMVAVDKTGCPLDKDADGVPDYLDACPDAAGPQLLNGCPDKDGDGIADKDDRCPDVAGSAAFQGCADTDADGVADIDDKCPDTKAGYKVDAAGCTLDNDKDGLVNEEDRCPDAAGPASLKGCPDTDGDGVADIDDRCPTIKGTIPNKGCPEITKEVETKITTIARNLFFETNSDVLKVASLSRLDELVLILREYENAKLTIEGHTDSQGADDFNMTLSEKRSASVRKYLIEKGISESRLMSKGFGESTPIADNKTAAGRAKNRRVELKTSY